MYLSIGEPGGGSVYWELLEIVEGGLWKRSIFLCGSCVRESGECFHRDLFLGTMGDAPFLEPSREG